MFECIRCTRQVVNEETYIIFKRKYCRACMKFIEHSREYTNLLTTLRSYRDIEN